jgi:quercetin dioxygenase-like cupin family protein
MSHPAMTRPAATERRFVLGPEKVRATILTTAEETDGRHDLIDSVLPAGSTTPLHLHTRYEERLFVVSGSLTAWIGHDKLVLRSGDYLHIPTDSRPTPPRRPGGRRGHPRPQHQLAGRVCRPRQQPDSVQSFQPTVSAIPSLGADDAPTRLAW